ncbi:hypothetical protein AOLI_G00110190 [Acnodon oligacanthus]
MVEQKPSSSSFFIRPTARHEEEADLSRAAALMVSSPSWRSVKVRRPNSGGKFRASVRHYGRARASRASAYREVGEGAREQQPPPQRSGSQCDEERPERSSAGDGATEAGQRLCPGGRVER